jgi:hypothetical protein
MDEAIQVFDIQHIFRKGIYTCSEASSSLVAEIRCLLYIVPAGRDNWDSDKIYVFGTSNFTYPLRIV